MRKGRLSAGPTATDTRGQRIRAARLGLGLSQWQLADCVGARQAQISQYELDEVRPRRDMLERIASALGVSTEALETPPAEAAGLCDRRGRPETQVRPIVAAGRVDYDGPVV